MTCVWVTIFLLVLEKNQAKFRIVFFLFRIKVIKFNNCETTNYYNNHPIKKSAVSDGLLHYQQQSFPKFQTILWIFWTFLGQSLICKLLFKPCLDHESLIFKGRNTRQVLSFWKDSLFLDHTFI